MWGAINKSGRSAHSFSSFPMSWRRVSFCSAVPREEELATQYIPHWESEWYFRPAVLVIAYGCAVGICGRTKDKWGGNCSVQTGNGVI